MQSNNIGYKRRPYRNIIFALIGIFMLISCEGKEHPPQPTVPEVATITVKPQEVVLSTELPGRTTPFRVAEIRPQVNGIIEKRLFTEGSDVKAGQTLYKIDSAPFQAAINNAKASLNKAKALLPTVNSRAERYKALLVNKAVSRQDYDDAFATLEQARADIEYWKANVETARINLEYCSVTAPISGRIGRSNVTEGAIVTAYQPMALATIQRLDPIYVDVPQSSIELLRLKQRLEEGRLDYDEEKQSNVKLILEDGSAYPLIGDLEFRDITVDPSTGSVILRAIFPNPEGVLLPGMFIHAIIKEGVNNKAMLVPQEGVFRDYQGAPIALVANSESIVEKRMLILDRSLGNKWLVVDGLTPGDRLIVEGMQRIRQGVTVKVVPFEEAIDEHLSPESSSKKIK